MTANYHTPHSTSAPLISAGINLPLAQLDAQLTRMAGMTVNPADYGADPDAPDNSAALTSAIAALGAAGGRITFPRGRFNFTNTVTMNGANSSIVIEGSGQGVTGSGTTLCWNGGAAPFLVVGGSQRGFVIRDLAIDNTGTGTIGVKVDGCDEFFASNVMIFPTVGFSTAGMALGTASSVVSASFSRTYIRGNAVGLLCGAIGAHLFAFGLRCIQNTTADLVLGDASNTVQSAHFYGSTFEGTAAGTSPVIVNRVQSATFDGCYFEHDGSGYALDIPSTAVLAWSVTMQGCFVAGGGFGHASTYAVNVNLAAAHIAVLHSYFLNYANPSYVVRNQSSTRVLLIGNDGDSTGMAGCTSYAAGAVTEIGSYMNGLKPDYLGNGGRGILMQEGSLPAAPGANEAVLFLVDSGAGKTVLKVRFASGAEQTIATQP